MQKTDGCSNGVVDFQGKYGAGKYKEHILTNTRAWKRHWQRDNICSAFNCDVKTMHAFTLEPQGPTTDTVLTEELPVLESTSSGVDRTARHGDDTRMLRMIFWDSDAESQLKWFYRGEHIATAKYPPGMGVSVVYGVNSIHMGGCFDYFEHQGIASTSKRTVIVIDVSPYLQAGEMKFDNANIGKFFIEVKKM